MSFGKANIAGLVSPQQQSEMKCILAGLWPPLKPLPVFKYETSHYRATIDFDKLRGEWVCRKTAFPSNQVQELRGELREITLALPHGEAEMLLEDAADQEHELEKDTFRRLEAIRDWRENYENGARYFELRNFLSESQRIELDDSLRLSLTARQLQFSSKNVSCVFDTLSTAGGRFATLIEVAKRNKAKRETVAQTQTEEILPEPATDPDSNLAHRQDADFCRDPEQPPAVSIKNVFQEPCQPSLLERMAAGEPQPFETETPEMIDTDSSFPGQPHLEDHSPTAFAVLGAQLQTLRSSADRTAGPPSRFPVLEISLFQVAVFASLILCAVVAFTVGLTMGRGPLGTRLLGVQKSVLTLDANSRALPKQDDESASRRPAPPAARLDNSAGHKEPAVTPFEQTPPVQSTPPAKSEFNSDPSGAPSLMEPALPPAPSKPSGPRATHPFRVTFPEKAIAATSSFAVTSQLSVLVPPEFELSAAHKPARLEAGQLVSFVWPRYPRPRHGLAEVIRVRAMVGLLGEVEGVKFLGGSVSLFPATTRAIHQWRYTPTLLDKRPVTVEQDLTIEFRPQSDSAQVPTRHPRNY